MHLPSVNLGKLKFLQFVIVPNVHRNAPTVQHFTYAPFAWFALLCFAPLQTCNEIKSFCCSCCYYSSCYIQITINCYTACLCLCLPPPFQPTLTFSLSHPHSECFSNVYVDVCCGTFNVSVRPSVCLCLCDMMGNNLQTTLYTLLSSALCCSALLSVFPHTFSPIISIHI